MAIPKKPTKRPNRDFSPPDDLEGIVEAIAAERERPIAKAANKLFDFVNSTVADPDFRHPESRALFEFLLLVRDELTDGINEQWNIDDILAPVITALRSHNGKQGRGKPRPRRKSILRLGLEELVKEGLSNDDIIELLGDADAISTRAAYGFPFEVCDPKTSVEDDGELWYYKTGASSDSSKPATVKYLKELLRRVRETH